MQNRRTQPDGACNFESLPQEEGPCAAFSASLQIVGAIPFTYDPVHPAFAYSPALRQQFAGLYDARPYWTILFDDGVASASDAEAVRRFILLGQTPGDATPIGESEQKRMLLPLKTLRGEQRYFMLLAADDADDKTCDVCTYLLIDTCCTALQFDISDKINEFDGLTGLLNRSSFLAQAGELMRAAPPNTYTLAYLDVNKFSAVNERYGHAAGDELLCQLARRFAQAQGGTAVNARISADCFALLLHRPTTPEVLSSACNIPFDRVQPPIEATLCIGFYVVDEPALPVDVMLDRAILAHDSVKHNFGKPYAYYRAELSHARFREQELELDMHRALAEEQFVVYFQPQYSLTDGGLVGAEALVRWQHPDKGLIMPTAFIALFERSGFISRMDGFVWNRVCKLLRCWLDTGKTVVPIAINLSRVDLFAPDLPERLGALVAQYSLPPSLLKLEITESLCSVDVATLSNVVRRLQEAGFSVAMDDFGSGYSSLNTLKDVPVDVLKLDMRFLGGDDTAGRGGSIINSVIRMAKWLSLSVIAEGVETSQQAAFLQSIGCDVAQGYLYARPMAEAAFVKVLDGAHFGRSLPRSIESNVPDPDAFWNPDSLETLLFNSYVGGAAIIEYAHGKVELMRFNERYLGLFGLGYEDADKLRMTLDSLPEEDLPTYLNMLDRAVETRQEALAITRRIVPGRSGGDFLYLRTRARVLAKSQQRTLVYIALEDVTAEHIAQDRLRESQELLLTAVTHVQLFYWVYDMEHDTAVQGSLGQENVGLPNVFDNYPQSIVETGFVHPDFIAPYLAMYDKLKAGATRASVDIKNRTPDGSYEWRRIRYSVIPDADGVARRAIGTSERMEAYKQLQARYLTAAMQNDLLVWHYHIDAHTLHYDTDMDTAMLEEAEPELARWMTPDAFFAGIHGEDRARFEALHETLAAGTPTASCFLRSRMDAGKPWQWYKVIYTLSIDKDGSAGIAVGTAANVTYQFLLQNRYQGALSQFRSLETDQCLGIIHLGTSPVTINLPSGKETRYDAFLTEWAAGIPDGAQRQNVLGTLCAEALLRLYGEGVSHVSCEYRLRENDCAVRWVSTTARILTDADTLTPTAFIYTQDVNRERMAQDVIMQVVNSNYGFVTAVDTRHGGYEMYITDPADAYRPAALGSSFADAVRDFATKVIHPDDRENYITQLDIQHVCDKLDAEGPFTFLYRSRDKDGRYRTQRLSVCYIDNYTRYFCIASRLDDRDAEG